MECVKLKFIHFFLVLLKIFVFFFLFLFQNFFPSLNGHIFSDDWTELIGLCLYIRESAIWISL